MTPAARKHKGNTEANAQACARQILETVPLAMRAIRREMRDTTEEQLSVPQFRVLAFLGRNQGTSLTAVSEHLGVKDATTSALVNRLVNRGLVDREIHPLERRRLELGLTRAGTTLLEKARGKAKAYLVRNLVSSSPADLQALAQGLEVLRRCLSEDMYP